MIRSVLGFLIAAPWPFVVAVVFLASALETAIFLGLFLPGELPVVLGGALASRGRVPLAAVVAAGILGPILGDSIGYFLGRRYGRRRIRSFRRRFTAFLRSIIPAAAGAARVPLTKFVPWCVAAGVIWGGASALLGYFLAKNFETLESFVSRFSLAILAVVVMGVGLSILRSRWKPRRKRRHMRSRSKVAPSSRRRKSA